MADKSPRETMSKKSGLTIRQKRAAKKSGADPQSGVDALVHGKKH